MSFHAPNDYRVTYGPMATRNEHGSNGAFELPPVIGGRAMFVIASDGAGWEHVSVHVRDGKHSRTPTWAEMCHVKALFWDDEDVVMQLHPRKSDYVNFHEHTLHLWRPIDAVIPTPDPLLVGPRKNSPAR
jgi:hypothetical protein